MARESSIATMTSAVYRRTQPGVAMIVAVLVLLGIETIVTFGRPIVPGAVAISAFLLCVGIVFSTMTIAVNEDYVQWWLTFGLLRQKVSLSEIQFAVSGRVTLLNGLGIRTNGRNWLWIVNGRDIVSLELRDGTKVSLGSPEAQTLALFIDNMLSSRR